MEIDEDTVNLTDYYHPTGSTTNNTGVIDTIDVSEYPTGSKKRTSNVYDKNLCKDNKPLTDFINKCIILDQTVGMEAIINKVMLPAYVKADTEYKQSEKFRRVVTKAFQRLINDPDRKYTHISDIVDTLRLHAATAPINLINSMKPTNHVKKRVNFVTLSSKVSSEHFGNTNENKRKRPLVESSSKVSPKKSKLEVIALDCDDDDDVIPIDNDTNNGMVGNHVEEMDDSSSTEKSNLVSGDTIEIMDSQELKVTQETHNNETVKENKNTQRKCNDDKPVPNEQYPVYELETHEPTVSETEHEKENLVSSDNFNDENKLLVPHKEKIVRLEKPKPKKTEAAELTEVEKAKKVKAIEAKIEKYYNTIAKLDLEEVTDDSANSPYYKCDRLRAMIVKLYKELCTLVGEEPPERPKIRLQTTEGLPKGPIKRLEKFLNKQVDAEGVAPFPDFSDVVRCVERANKKDGLGWSSSKVIEEARAIFSYCGRALQKRRQQREWKHLRSQVRPEEFEADPAESDLELQARLEANRRLARQREAEVFSKFTRMETEPIPTATTSLQIEESIQIKEPSEEDSSSDEEPAEPTINPTVETPVLEEPNNTTDCLEIDASIVKQEPVDSINTQYKGDISLVIDISDSESDDDMEIGTLTF